MVAVYTAVQHLLLMCCNAVAQNAVGCSICCKCSVCCNSVRAPTLQNVGDNGKNLGTTQFLILESHDLFDYFLFHLFLVCHDRFLPQQLGVENQFDRLSIGRGLLRVVRLKILWFPALIAWGKSSVLIVLSFCIQP